MDARRDIFAIGRTCPNETKLGASTMTAQPDLFDQPAAHGPGQRQTDIEQLIAERGIEGEGLPYAEAYTRLSDARATLSSTFGYPGTAGYRAYYRTSDGTRYELSNGSWADSGTQWSIKRA